jgi:hypothetical protein
LGKQSLVKLSASAVAVIKKINMGAHRVANRFQRSIAAWYPRTIAESKFAGMMEKLNG